MKIRFEEDVNRNEWDERLCSMGGTIFHSSTWAEYGEKTSKRVVPKFITLVSEEGEILGIALGFHQFSSRKFISRFTKRLWLDAIPVVRNQSKTILYEFLTLLSKQAYDLGYLELFVGSYASDDVSEEMKELCFELRGRIEFVIDLDISEEDLWKGLAHKRRKNIRKSRRCGVILNEMTNDKGLAELRRLQGESISRIREREGISIGSHTDTQEDPLRVLVESGHGRIIVAESDGEAVSASLFTCFNDLVYHTISGHSRKAFETQAPTLLLWEMILKYRSEGAKKFNLSGCKSDAVEENSSEHGIYNYKRAFGGDPIECASGRRIFHKYQEKAVNAARAVLHSQTIGNAK